MPDTHQEAIEPDRRKPWWPFIALVALLPYLNAFGNEFVRDDIVIIRDNARIRSLSGVVEGFASNYWGEAVQAGLYRPLVLATYAVNHALGGLDTTGYTAVNLALHALVSVLVLLLARSLGASRLACTATAVLFAVHPVHTESVTGFVGRADVLSAAGFLLALLAHRRIPAARGRAWVLRLGGGAAFLAGLLAKESAITLLAVLPVLDAVLPSVDQQGRPVPLRSRLRKDYGLWLGVAVVYLVVRVAVLGSLLRDPATIDPSFNPLVPAVTSALGDVRGAAPAQALLSAVAVLGEYARLLVWPVRLSADYSFDQLPLVGSPFEPRFLLGMAVVVAVLGGAVALRRRQPLAAFGLAFGALSFGATSNLLFPFGTICAERLLYLPSAGFLLALGAGLERAARPGRRRAVLAALLVVSVSFAARTWTRNRDWHDSTALWSAAAVACPQSFKAHASLGIALKDRADRLRDEGTPAAADEVGRRARRHLERAVEILPEYLPANRALADLYWTLGESWPAVRVYERLERLDPGNERVLIHWAATLLRQAAAARDEQREELVRAAESRIDAALALKPDSAEGHYYRGVLYLDYRHDPARAAVSFHQTLRLQPDHPRRAAILRRLEED